jgi:tryptophan 2,3-dioxygenase
MDGRNPQKEVYYHDYLQLDRLLNSQERESEKHGDPAHDEMLFITVHQAYELWFKQIGFELEAVCDFFSGDVIDEKSVARALSYLCRIVEIQKVIFQHLDVMETMTPLDFLDFRDYLLPASGFQSWQFRVIENRLGIDPDLRMGLVDKPSFLKIAEREQALVDASLSKPSLFALIEKWLERIPFLDFQGFNFWQSYRKAAHAMLTRDEEIIQKNSHLSEKRMALELAHLQDTRHYFDTIFDEEKYNQLKEKGERRLSHKAMKAALLINLYREEPLLQLPFRLLSALMDIDQQFTNWRYRHMLMVRRIIGQRIGTGGSSGQDYLRQGAEKLRIFSDLFTLSTFFIPRSSLPDLPQEIQKALDFSYHPAA